MQEGADGEREVDEMICDTKEDHTEGHKGFNYSRTTYLSEQLSLYLLSPNKHQGCFWLNKNKKKNNKEKKNHNNHNNNKNNNKQ